jgi:serine/threonine-protein kinase
VAVSALPPFTQPCGKPGASGSVFKIEYQGKVAAAKEFHKHMQDMLRRELKSLQLLAHPNIVRVLAVINDAASQPIGFVMEHCAVPLNEAMQSMTLRQSVHALAEAAIGVAAAHDSQIIHSDIKPDNILCSEDFSVIKLADFGLAHAITASMSAVSGVRGTALFMAPELHEDAPLSVSTDVFSFGMTAWQLLHPGVTNPLGTNIVTISNKLGRGLRPDFTRLDAPPALKELVARCLEHDPAKRPASMWEVHR